MTQLLLWTAALSMAVAAPCAAGPSEDVAGATKAWTARFSLRDGRWLIVDHHSSSVPAAPRQ